ncbi:MAG: hypothetical protein L3J26_05755 [Candidatus Polarisedimenticolaceae bacterium]|nr:hypothetical protein [Candidatus Polarisedimenticolaceae bacterium]
MSRSLISGIQKMRSFHHLTPRYVWNRFALMAYERANPELPWLTRDMINILGEWLCSTDVGLEFGSGRSTSWFAKRVRHLTSVENNPEWFEIVQNQIQDLPVEYFLHQDGTDNVGNSEYVAVAQKLPFASLDFCLIDGMARDHCALACLDKIKPGGILIIDNVERYIPREHKTFSPNSRSISDGYASEIWEQVGKELQKWRCIWTTNGVTDTAFWVKPYV